MENDPFLAFLFLCLLQEEDTDPGDHEGHDARVNREGNVDREQQSTEDRGDHSASETQNNRSERTQSPSRGGRKGTHILDSAEAIPHAEPLTFVEKISGVQPYNIPHIVVEANEVPIVLAFNSRGPSTLTKTKQKKAVRKVLPANDHRRPKGESTR